MGITFIASIFRSLTYAMRPVAMIVQGQGQASEIAQDRRSLPQTALDLPDRPGAVRGLFSAFSTTHCDYGELSTRFQVT